MKRCSCCHEEKADEAFYANHRYTDGLSSRCRACNRSASARHRATEDKMEKNDYQNQWRKQNPEKYRAQKDRQVAHQKLIRAEARAAHIEEPAA